MKGRELIDRGQAILGIEFGSTRIKAVLIDSENKPIASGAWDWENKLVDGVWSYSLEAVREGLQGCYADLQKDVERQYGTRIHTLKALGISAMMHGYLAFDKEGKLLVPFRTWRNTITGKAARALTDLFSYPIPQRWTIAHLYESMLEGQSHVKDIAMLFTLASYVHYRLTGRRVIGIDDASGMFPIDPAAKDYNAAYLDSFQALAAKAGYGWDIRSLLPKVLVAGEDAGRLTGEGAELLDPSGKLQPGIPLCPPEGDAATGMAATDSVLPRTGNVSAGTSVFAMVVLEKNLSKAYFDKIDIVATPDGRPAAMSHANNCTGDYDAWLRLFGEVSAALGHPVQKGELYDKLLPLALKGEKDGGGLLPYNYISGEAMTDVPEGRPLFIRSEHARFTLANFMRAQLYTALGALRRGMDILFDEEHVTLEKLNGHGGFFKTPHVGQRIMASALHTPVSVLTTAGEGGAWGIALLASFLVGGKGRTLPSFLEEEVFKDAEADTYAPTQEEVDGFNAFYRGYLKAIPLERRAAELCD